MQVKQIYALVNDATKEVLGETALVNEDLSNLVEIGDAITNVGGVDNYVKALVDRIGKVIFVNRAYAGKVPSVLRDSWEFGSILQKVSAILPDADENETWKLVHGASYDPNIYYEPTVEVSYFNGKVTFEIDLSFTSIQVKESFTSASAMNGFISMLYNEVDKSMTVKIDSLVMKTIANAIGDTFYDEFPGGTYTGVTSVKAVNLLKEYNDAFGTSLTAAAAITNKDFLRFAAIKIGIVSERLTAMSKLFNIGDKARFTPKDLQHIVLLADFAKGVEGYMQSDTFHDDLVQLPKYETVPYWQGSGTSFAWGSIDAIDVTTKAGHTVTPTGILGVIFDHDAIAVCNQDRRVLTQFNPKGEFYTNFYKFDCEFINAQDENFVVFYVA